MATARDLAVDAVLVLDRDDGRVREALLALRGEVADPRDRGLLTEVAYGVARRLGTLDAVLARASRTPLPRLDPAVRAALRVGLYQALFLDRVPPSAAVDAAVESVKGRAGPRLAGFVNGVLRTILRGLDGPASGAEDPCRDVPRPGAASVRFSHPTFPDPAVDLAGNLAERFAHPAWLVARWLDRWGEARTRSLLALGCARPPLCLRAAPGTRAALVEELVRGGVGARAGDGPDEVVCPDGDPEALAPVRDRRATVQDGTAQRVAPLVAPRGGERVLDLCAAPGGKTLHLLDLLGASGEVVAADVSPEKVDALARTLATRPPSGAGARAVLVPERGPLPFAPASFDAVVLDAPCSNTGVLRRRPEAKARLRPRDLASLAALQDDLLARARVLVRPGGRLVYATCSIEPEEGEDRRDRFLAAHRGATLAAGFSVLPTDDRDGGFAAAFVLP